MSSLKTNLKAIYLGDKGLLVLLILNFLFGIFIFIWTLIVIDPASAVVRIGYGDIGGYRDGGWANLLSFPILAILFGTLHDFLGVKIFEKNGTGIAKVFVFISILLLLGVFVVFLRLSGEN